MCMDILNSQNKQAKNTLKTKQTKKNHQKQKQNSGICSFLCMKTSHINGTR